MDYPTSKNPKHYSSRGGGSTDRQNVNLGQSGSLPVATTSAQTSAGLGGAYATEDNLNPAAQGIEQMEQVYKSRGPPKRPLGVPNKQKPQSSSTQQQTLRRPEVQTRLHAASVQGPPVATPAGNRPPQPRAQTNQTTWGQTHQPHGQMPQVPHGQTYQVPHGQMPQVPHGQTHQVPHGQTHQVPHGQMPQVPHGQTHQVPHGQMPQVPHGQTHQVPHGQTHQVPHGQTHQVPHGQTSQPTQVQMPRGQAYQVPHGQTYQAPHGQTSQPTQVQMPRATGGTSSHDPQRSLDRRRNNDRTPAVTANQPTTAGYRR